MIFIGGFGQGQKNLEFLQTMICKRCGRLSGMSAVMVYSYFSFFFIPLFKWNKQYFVVSNCCNTSFPISKELGKSIERKEQVTLREEDLEFFEDSFTQSPRHCMECGFLLTPEYTYCPKCGKKIDL